MNNSSDPGNDNITLQILDELSKGSTITQRTLSSKLNIALGLVNTYIKRLAKKGYIKIKKGPMNRVKYVLTPAGFTHRVGLTYDYMHNSINYFKSARKKIDDIYQKMIANGVKEILIWGDGEVAELSYVSMRGLPLKLVGVIDGKSKEKDFFGHPVYSYENIQSLNYDAILIASFNEQEIQEINNLGIPGQKIYSL